MVSRIFYFIVLFFFFGCTQQDNFPTPLSEKVDLKTVQLTSNLPVFHSNSSTIKIEGIEELNYFMNQYQKKNSAFDLDKFKQKWIEIYRNLDIYNSDNSDLKDWFEITSLLFELSGEAGFSTELERLALSGAISKEQVAPSVFTKNIDHIFTNIFTPAKIEYKHSTGGDVKIEMITDYPKSGKVELHFNMTDRRYIEVNIRIPDWAEGATVTVKHVKYFAPPGGYCKIAKKWKDNDLVEIQFPTERIPEYLK